MTFKPKFWINISLFNLVIIAFLGLIMRYKIGFDFPFLNQKNILHAHSHFAFTGWITHTIFVLLLYLISKKSDAFNFKLYKKPLVLNLFCAYGMLVSFFISGYSLTSIILSTITIFNNVFFTYLFFKDFRKIIIPAPSIPWLKAALAFNLISSIGTFYLAYMMSCHHFNERLYLASVYFYLHFQYNGFFIFSCFGFMTYMIEQFLPGFHQKKIVFILIFSACIPSYFLSTLWANLPTWLYFLVVFAAITQLTGWLIFIKQIYDYKISGIQLTRFSKYMLVFVALAYTIKLSLQLGSTIPEVSKLAFGFRPVVIAYLHLVLLAIVTVFLLSQIFILQLIDNQQKSKNALLIILSGIFLNEICLGIQGIASFNNLPIPYINDILLVITIIIFSGSVYLMYNNRHNQ